MRDVYKVKEVGYRSGESEEYESSPIVSKYMICRKKDAGVYMWVDSDKCERCS